METNLKITIDQLKNYLSTGLKIMDGWGDVRNFKYTHLDDDGNHGEIFGIKPICYRLSDLDKFIPELGFVPIEELANGLGGIAEAAFNEVRLKRMSYDNMPYWAISKIFKWHFWPFGDEYFDQGLVIDKLKQ